MRFSRTVMGCTLCVLIGCALLPEQPISPLLMNNVSSKDLQSLSPGEWCRVRLTDARDGHIHTHIEHIGQITQVDEDSMTLSKVTTRRVVINDLSEVPVIGQLYKTPDFAEDEIADVTLFRNKMAHVERVSSKQAAELKQPLKRAKVDVKENAGTAHLKLQPRGLTNF